MEKDGTFTNKGYTKYFGFISFSVLIVRGGLIEMDAEAYLVWPKVNPFILRQDERIYFYKTLIEELGQLYAYYISHRALWFY